LTLFELFFTLVTVRRNEMEKYQFETFQKIGKRAVLEPMVSMVRSGNLNFNRNFMEKFAENKHFVVFHFDKEKKILGLELTKEKQPFSYPLRTYRDRTMGTVTSISLLRHYSIPFGKSTHSYKAEWDDEYKMVIIDLNKEVKQK